MMSNAVFYVYVLFRPWDGSPFYVGKGKDRRWLNHIQRGFHSGNRHLMAIIQRARAEQVEIPRVKVRENLTEAEAFEIEVALIAAIGRGENGPLANMTDGGEGISGYSHSAAARAKISAAAVGNKRPLGLRRSAETRALLSAIAKSRPPETRTAFGNLKRGKPLSQEHKAKLRAAKLGKKQRPEATAAIAKSNRGRKRSVETRLRMSLAQLGNQNSLGTVHSPEARQRMSEAAVRREVAKRLKRQAKV